MITLLGEAEPLESCCESQPLMRIKVNNSWGLFPTISSLLILIFTYLIFVRTDLGQRFDDSAFLGRYEISKRARLDFGKLLDLINRSSLALMVIALVVYALWSRNMLLAARVFLAFAVSTIGAEILKRTLPRPEVDFLEEITKDGGLNTFPSGHSTIATSLVLAILLLSPTKWRAGMALFGTAWVIIITTGTLIAGWHRPSDAIGGITLAIGVFGIALNLREVDENSSESSGNPELSKRFLLIWAVMSSALLIGLLRGIQNGLNESISPWTFPIAALSIITYASYSLHLFTRKFIRFS